MHPAFMFRLTFVRLVLISLIVLPWIPAPQAQAQIDRIILKAKEYEASRILEPVSDSEFHALFGIRSLDLLVKERLAALTDVEVEEIPSPFRDLSIDVLPSIRPHPPLKQRDVLPEEFSILIRSPLPTPTLVLAGYEGQPEISELGCATREHSQHNLAYRCNAPIALNVPGGNTPSKSFLREMEEETGFDIGYDLWPGDKDAVTGDRLLSARDIVTGMRFTLAYLNHRGFTIAKNSCSDRKHWRWSYICMHDENWAAMSATERCEFVLEGLLTVEGGTPNWSFAPMPSPDTVEGELIAVGLTHDPRNINDPGALCREIIAQNRVDKMVKGLLRKAPKALGLKQTSLAAPDEAYLTLGARVNGTEIIVARLTSASPSDLPGQMKKLQKIWRSLGGSQVCDNADCAGPVQVALPPLPDYRPPQPASPLPLQIAETSTD